MDAATAAGLQAVLSDMELPAEKTALLEHAVRRHAEPVLIGELRSLPERMFESIDEVVDVLSRR